MNNFTEESYAVFHEAASEKYDFSTCQRGDGTYYGTGGTCRKGSDVPGGVPKKEKAASSGGGGGGGGSASTGGGGGGGAPTKADISTKRKEVREMDKTAKAADKKADKADKDWRKAGAPKGAQQQEVRRLDKLAKSANKEADKGQKELERMNKSATSAKGRQSNEAVNKAISNTTQDGPKPTGAQRQQAMKVLRQERNRLESMQDDGKLTKAGEARLKLVKASQREYEIQGKQRMTRQTSAGGSQARSQAKASGEVADRKAAARKENEAKKASNPRTDSKMSSKRAAEVKAAFDKKRQMKAGGQDGPEATTKQRAAAVKNLTRQKNTLLNKQDENGKLSKADSAKLKLIEASMESYR